jgi:hypothetical protein
MRYAPFSRITMNTKLLTITRYGLAAGMLAGTLTLGTASVGVAQETHAATHPAAAMSAHIQAGPQYQPPDPC